MATRQDLMDALTEKGVEFDPRAKKDELEALLEGRDANVLKYDVIVDGGNSPGGSMYSLDELGAFAERVLVKSKRRQVTILVKARMVEGDPEKEQFGKVRADGVEA